MPVSLARKRSRGIYIASEQGSVTLLLQTPAFFALLAVALPRPHLQYHDWLQWCPGHRGACLCSFRRLCYHSHSFHCRLLRQCCCLHRRQKQQYHLLRPRLQ